MGTVRWLAILVCIAVGCDGRSRDLAELDASGWLELLSHADQAPKVIGGAAGLVGGLFDVTPLRRMAEALGSDATCVTLRGVAAAARFSAAAARGERVRGVLDIRPCDVDPLSLRPGLALLVQGGHDVAHGAVLQTRLRERDPAGFEVVCRAIETGRRVSLDVLTEISGDGDQVVTWTAVHVDESTTCTNWVLQRESDILAMVQAVADHDTADSAVSP
jgi:hypothetical protein